MKKVFLLLIGLLMSLTSVFSQVPDAINFQAIARDENGDVMANTTIMIQLTILDGGVSGTEVYREIRSLVTNGYGSFSFQIGREPFMSEGDFTLVEWETGNKYMKVDYDPTASLNFDLTLGTIEFVTVPYAFAAGAVSYIDMNGVQDGDILVYNTVTGKFEPGNYSATETDPVFVNSPSYDILNSDITDWNTAFGWGNHENAGYLTSFTEIDGSVTNEIQSLSISGNDLSISNGNTITLPIGTNYTAGTGISISGNSISNTGDLSNTNEIELPTQTGNTGKFLSTNGTLPSWTTALTSEVDGSVTNELQTLSLTDNLLSISNGNSVTLNLTDNFLFLTRDEMNALTPENGQVIYNTTDNITLMWNGYNWIELGVNCFPQPTTSNAGSDLFLWSTDFTANLSANLPEEGVGSWSVVSGSGGSFSNINEPNAIFTGTSYNSYILRWSIVTDCNVSYDDVVVEFISPNSGPTGQIIGNTYYDLQTNNTTSERIYVAPNGKISMSWTFAPDNTANFPNRGTGYAYYNGSSWTASPTNRIESLRTGWPTVSVTGAGNEIIVAHDGANLIQNISTFGAENWVQSTILNSSNFFWPRSAVCGTDNNTVNIISVLSDGSLNNLRFLQTQDQGSTWNLLNLPTINQSVGGDIYSITARGNTIAFVVFGFYGDVIMYKSIDNGVNWTTTIINDFPVDNFDINTTLDIDLNSVADTLYTSDGSGDILIDNSGMVHVVFSTRKYLNGGYNSNGGELIYWNENMGAANFPGITSPDFIGLNCTGEVFVTKPDLNGNGIWDVGENEFGNYRNSVVSMPTMGCDVYNNIFVVYSAVMEGDYYLKTDATPNPQHYRHIWGIARKNNGTWCNPVNLISADEALKENVYPAIYHDIIGDNNIHLIYMNDNEPGINLQGDEDPINNNQIIYKRFQKTLLLNNTKSAINTITVETNSELFYNNLTEIKK